MVSTVNGPHGPSTNKVKGQMKHTSVFTLLLMISGRWEWIPKAVSPSYFHWVMIPCQYGVYHPVCVYKILIPPNRQKLLYHLSTTLPWFLTIYSRNFIKMDFTLSKTLSLNI